MTNTLTSTQMLPYAREIERDPHLASAHTRRAYRTALDRFETWRNGRTLTVTLVEEYLTTLQRDGLKPASVNHALAVIRWWARRVAKLAGEYASPQDAQRIEDLAARVITVQDVKGNSVHAGRHLDDPEIIALLETCAADPSPIGVRDHAILSVSYSTGARIHEIKTLTLDDITYTEEGADLLIHGKGGKTRIAYLYNGALESLNSWINLRGIDPGVVFNPIHKGGKVITTRGISLEGLRKILKGRQIGANLDKSLTWHDFRRTFIGKALDAGADLSTVQSLAGHADPTTTSRYDRRPDRRKREVVQIVSSLTLKVPEK